MNTDINTCTGLAQYGVLIYYSHLVPIVIGALLAIFALFQSKFSTLSKIFFMFISIFCLWLFGDLITWITHNYYLVNPFWAPLDYLNIVFFASGVYFFGLLARGRVSTLEKILLFSICIPLFVFGITGTSIVALDQSQCQAITNGLDNMYLLYAEGFCCVMLIVSFFIAWFERDADKLKRPRIIVIGLSILSLFLIFSITNYLSSASGAYQTALYANLTLPIFFIIIAFTISNLGLFQLRFLGTQLLAYVLLVVVGSQLLVVQNAVNRNLIFVTFAVALFISYLLLRNTNREIGARAKIEKLARELEEANKGQENLIHVMNHQIKGYLAKDRGVFSELLADGEYGTINDMGKTMIKQGFESATKGIDFVQDILKGSSAQMGTLPYNMQTIDFKKVVSDVVAGQKKNAEDKGLKFSFIASDGDYSTVGDPTHLGEAVRNLIDNSINYTPQGSISLSLKRDGDKIVFAVKDTGVGINDEDKAKLFTQGGRGKDSARINVNSTGYGLVFVKSVVEAHKGHVWADSAGTGKGSTFTMELPAGH